MGHVRDLRLLGPQSRLEFLEQGLILGDELPELFSAGDERLFVLWILLFRNLGRELVLLASQRVDLRDQFPAAIPQVQKCRKIDGDAPVTTVFSDTVDVIADELKIKHQT